MTVTLKIEKSVYGGDGLARLGDGRVAFVPGAFPGETVKARISDERRRFVRCTLEEVLEASGERIPLGAAVPGMVYAAVTPKEEMRLKADQLGNFLWKVARESVPVKVHPMEDGDELNYRNKATYHFSRVNGRWTIGYLKEGTHEIVDVLSDPLVLPAINAKIPEMRAGVTSLLTQGSESVRRSTAAMETVTMRYTALDGVKWWAGKAPHGLVLKERTAGLTFKVAADGFYQVNPKVGDALVSAVVKSYLDGASMAAHVLDLYCGVGVLGLSCIKAAPPVNGAQARLVGVESGHDAVRMAKENAASLSLKASFFAERAGAGVRNFKVGPHHTVIADPPRGGMEANVARWLAGCRAGRIFYISCDPATLTRDLGEIARGGWRIKDAQLFNMFPRTARFETFVRLERQ